MYNKLIPYKSNKLAINYLRQFYDVQLIWTDWSRLLLVGIPTILHIILMFEFFKLTHYSYDYFYLFILIAPTIIAAGKLITICIKSNEDN